MIRTPFFVLGGLLLSLLAVGFCDGHEKSKSSFLRQRAIALAKADALAEDREDSAKHGLCELTIELVDAKTKAAIPGAVRITNLESDKAVNLSGEIHRALNWYSLEEGATVKVPRTKIRIEALRGLETELATHEVDLTSTEKKTVKISLKRFADPAANGFRSGNTHLHLTKLTHAEAIRYLELVPRGDDLDLVFLSRSHARPWTGIPLEAISRAGPRYR